jgi:hypothetical protein
VELALIAAALGHRDLKSTVIYARTESKNVRKGLETTAVRMLGEGDAAKATD